VRFASGHARDKLLEARFFLSRLKRSKGKQPRFRYYASATLTAARSISLVLQHDLRSTHGEAFDRWWEENRVRTSSGPLGFEYVRQARNLVLKEGNRVLRPVVRQEYTSGPIKALEVVLDPVGDGDLSSIKVSLDPNDEFGRIEIPDGASKEEVAEIAAPHIARMLDLLGKLRDRDTPFVAAGFETVPGAEVLPFDQVAEALTLYLDEMEALVEEATKLFPVKHWSERGAS
jgi:hypothetical protein